MIPNRNGGHTIGKCLTAALASRYEPFEVVVVDDFSTDDSVAVIEQTLRAQPRGRLIRLPQHAGAAGARNAGAANSAGEILFFIDADCLLEPDSLAAAQRAVAEQGPDTVVGGTYTIRPYDRSFFSRFQSAFIHYSETKKLTNPDYIASHALVIAAATFRGSGGFPEQFMPIIEDVEYTHRLRRNGHRLVMHQGILVQHIFNFSFRTWFRNAFRKSRHWTRYSLYNHDVFADSGTASLELKVDVVVFFVVLLLLLAALVLWQPAWLLPVPFLLAGNALVSRGLLRTFRRAGGLGFFAAAVVYYSLVYPLPVAVGAAVGLIEYPRKGVR
ncbi:MAG TPA: glycosyltransferase family 2 protein [Planctomycetota bacterium]|nr:glycosyltransferase family 2 protein [Planctomycetota bacterium]